MPSEKLTFTGSTGQSLAARFDTPDGPHLATAIFAHCFTCSKDIPAAKRISQRLAAMGIAVLRFDFTGLGHSEGEFANTDFTSNVGDLKAAAQRLASLGTAPTLLIGHSLGGAAVLKAAAEIDGIKAVVTLGAPFDPAHVLTNFNASLQDIRTNGQARVSLAGRSFTVTRAFLEDVDKARLDPAIKALKAALLILHAPRDEIVGIDNAAAILMPLPFSKPQNTPKALSRWMTPTT